MTVIGGKHTIVGGLKEMYDRRGTFPLGETSCTITVLGVCGGYGVGVAGIPPKDAGQKGNRQ